MKFGYTIIYVPDVEQALAFYEKAFGLEQSFLHESKQYGELSTGETKLAFVSEAMAEYNGVTFYKNHKDQPAAGIEIALVTENVQSAYDQSIAAGALAVQAPAEKPWGQMLSYVRDLNGVLVEICSPMPSVD